MKTTNTHTFTIALTLFIGLSFAIPSHASIKDWFSSNGKKAALVIAEKVLRKIATPALMCRKGSGTETISLRSGKGYACKVDLIAATAELVCAPTQGTAPVTDFKGSSCDKYAMKYFKTKNQGQANAKAVSMIANSNLLWGEPKIAQVVCAIKGFLPAALSENAALWKNCKTPNS